VSLLDQMFNADGDTAIHPTTVVDVGARIGPRTRIWHFCHVSAGAVIGADCVLGQNCFVADNVIIGNRVKIGNNVSIYEGVEIEDDVFCGPSMVFTNVLNPRSAVSRRSAFARTLVRRGATIGANATVLCGCTLGPYSFAGAGAVVCRDLLAHELALGVPARAVGWMSRHGERLVFGPDDFASCPATGERYRKIGGRVEMVVG